MKAIRIHHYGGPEVLRVDEIGRPNPGAGQVVVRVRAAGVNPVDWKIREGFAAKLLDLQMPVVLGAELAGTVESIGSGVADLDLEDAVFGMIGLCGAYAEYVAVPANLLAHKPAILDFEQAACVPLSALTAWAALFETAKLKAGQRILIHAASGGVGSIAVQMARSVGAQVVGTTSARNQERVLALGAEKVINYEVSHFENEVGRVDVVFDLVGADAIDRSWAVLNRGGILVSAIIPPDTGAAAAAGVRTGFVAVQPDGTRLSRIGQMIQNGDISVPSPSAFAIEDAAEAQSLSQSGHPPGRIVLVMPERYAPSPNPGDVSVAGAFQNR